MMLGVLIATSSSCVVVVARTEYGVGSTRNDSRMGWQGQGEFRPGGRTQAVMASWKPGEAGE